MDFGGKTATNGKMEVERNSPITNYMVCNSCLLEHMLIPLFLSGEQAVDATSGKKRNRVSQDNVMDTNRVCGAGTPIGQLGLTIPCPDEEEQPHVCQDQSDHKWDDVLRAIDEDLRAFWGLWTTVILPRLDPNIPTERETVKVWNGDGVDISNVWVQTEDLQAQVKKLVDKRQTKPGEDPRWRECLDGIVTYQYPDPSGSCFREFTCRTFYLHVL